MELLIGVLGAGTILVAFVLNQLHVFKDTDPLYDGLNVLGSALLVLYALLIGSLPFLILNAVWLGVSVRDLLLARGKKSTRKR